MTHASRSAFHGMIQIIRFNWPFYAAASGVLLGGALLLALRPALAAASVPFVLGTSVALWWTLASLIASHWVYDRSGLTRWHWMRDLVIPPPRRWTNLHAGFDETSEALTAVFPPDGRTILNFYDPRTTPEPSIDRARNRRTAPLSSVSCQSSRLPLADGSQDAIFLLLAAHEIRDATLRTAFFAEIRRALMPGGSLVLVEHLRDAANFAAYGPGFLHFLPRKEWLRLGDEACLELAIEQSMTPFVRLFVWRKTS